MSMFILFVKSFIIIIMASFLQVETLDVESSSMFTINIPIVNIKASG